MMEAKQDQPMTVEDLARQYWNVYSIFFSSLNLQDVQRADFYDGLPDDWRIRVQAMVMTQDFYRSIAGMIK